MGVLKTSLSMFLLSIGSIATANAGSTWSHGIVNVNANNPPQKANGAPVSVGPQDFMMFGCNTVVNTNISMGPSNQIIDNVPYGHIKKAKDNPFALDKTLKNYHVNKYYLISPPLPDNGSETNATNIGLLTPDRFTFTGNKPAQIVNFDYSILKPTYISFVKANFKNPNSEGKTCEDEGIIFLPVDVQCEDFPWKNGAEGGGGIGFMKYSKKNLKENKVGFFIPTMKANGKSPLNCEITLLNDILPTHTVSFNSKGNYTTNLTELLKSGKSMELVCDKRPSLPAGCSIPLEIAK